MPPPVSIQGKCTYIHSKNRKGDYDLGRNIIQNQSVFWCNGKKEEGLLEV